MRDLKTSFDALNYFFCSEDGQGTSDKIGGGKKIQDSGVAREKRQRQKQSLQKSNVDSIASYVRSDYEERQNRLSKTGNFLAIVRYFVETNRNFVIVLGHGRCRSMLVKLAWSLQCR